MRLKCDSSFNNNCWLRARRSENSLGVSYTESKGVTVMESTPAIAALIASVCERSRLTYESNKVMLNVEVVACTCIWHALSSSGW